MSGRPEYDAFHHWTSLSPAAVKAMMKKARGVPHCPNCSSRKTTVLLPKGFPCPQCGCAGPVDQKAREFAATLDDDQRQRLLRTLPSSIHAGVCAPLVLMWIVHGDDGAKMSGPDLNSSADALCLKLLGVADPEPRQVREFVRVARASWLASNR